MKYFTSLLFMLLFALIIVSCGGDDTSGPEGLVGEWQGVSFEADQSFSFDVNGTMFGATSTLRGTNMNLCFEMTQDSFYTTGVYDLIYAITYEGQEEERDTLTQDPVDDSGTYSTNGDTLNTTASFFNIIDIQTGQVSTELIPATYEISGNELTVMQQYNRESVNQDGVVVNVMSKATAKYIRK